MNPRSSMVLSALPLAMVLAVAWVATTSPGHAAAGLGVGACVTVREQPGPAKIIRVTPGGYVVQPQGKAASEAMNWQQDDVTTGPCPSAAATAAQLAQPHACFASDPDSNGGTPIERRFRGLIRRTMEREAAQGSDGAVTVSFQSFTIGRPRRWLRSDGFNFSSDQSKPIYDLRVTYKTCTDYRAAIDIRQQERNFECFTAPTGDAACQMSGSTGGMAQDKQQYIPKR
ncbi:MAG TPA: hypothetical protein VII63_09505 [Caulobacteraceae bacterium]